MTDRQPDATSTGLSSAKKRRLQALSTKHCSTKRPNVSPSTHEPVSHSVGYQDTQPLKDRTTETTQKDGILYAALERSKLCDQLQALIPKAKNSAAHDLATEFLNSLLINTVAAGTGAQAVQRNVKDRFLHLDNPASAKAVSASKKALRMKGPPSRSVIKNLQRIPSDQYKFSLYQPLHELWRQQHVAQVLATGKHASVLRDITWHGAGVMVSECSNRNQVGQAGIIVQIRQNTVQVITPADQLLVVAKSKSTFHVKLNDTQSIVLRGECMGHV